MPCGVLNVPVSVDDSSLVESAEGCDGAASEQRSWATAYFMEPLIYQLDTQALSFTNGLGQIRFSRD